MELKRATELAELVKAELAPTCTQIEIAGSVRRRKAECGDIEIVCVPKPVGKPVFGQKIRLLDPLEAKVDELLSAKRLERRLGMGPKFKALWIPTVDDKWQPFDMTGDPDYMALDLFIVRPPAQWGVQFTIRTGPAEFSHWLVTKVNQGGGCPNHLSVKDGGVWDRGTLIPTPTEESFFGIMGEHWIEPANREPRWRKVKVR